LGGFAFAVGDLSGRREADREPPRSRRQLRRLPLT